LFWANEPTFGILMESVVQKARKRKWIKVRFKMLCSKKIINIQISILFNSHSFTDHCSTFWWILLMRFFLVISFLFRNYPGRIFVRGYFIFSCRNLYRLLYLDFFLPMVRKNGQLKMWIILIDSTPWLLSGNKLNHWSICSCGVHAIISKNSISFRWSESAFLNLIFRIADELNTLCRWINILQCIGGCVWWCHSRQKANSICTDHDLLTLH